MGGFFSGVLPTCRVKGFAFYELSTYGALGFVVCCQLVYCGGCKGCWFPSSFLFINLDDIG